MASGPDYEDRGCGFEYRWENNINTHLDEYEQLYSHHGCYIYIRMYNRYLVRIG